MCGGVRGVHTTRNQYPVVKGCTLVKYVYRQSCLHAIDVANEGYVMRGGSRPLFVGLSKNKRKPRVLIVQSASSSPVISSARSLRDEGGWRGYFAAARVGGYVYPSPPTVPRTLWTAIRDTIQCLERLIIAAHLCSGKVSSSSPFIMQRPRTPCAVTTGYRLYKWYPLCALVAHKSDD